MELADAQFNGSYRDKIDKSFGAIFEGMEDGKKESIIATIDKINTDINTLRYDMREMEKSFNDKIYDIIKAELDNVMRERELNSVDYINEGMNPESRRMTPEIAYDVYQAIKPLIHQDIINTVRNSISFSVNDNGCYY